MRRSRSVLPSATKHRRVGLITYGPGRTTSATSSSTSSRCRMPQAIMRAVEALVPAGKTPLTSAVEQAAEVLDYRSKPGVIVL